MLSCMTNEWMIPLLSRFTFISSISEKKRSEEEIKPSERESFKIFFFSFPLVIYLGDHSSQDGPASIKTEFSSGLLSRDGRHSVYISPFSNLLIL